MTASRTFRQWHAADLVPLALGEEGIAPVWLDEVDEVGASADELPVEPGAGDVGGFHGDSIAGVDGRLPGFSEEAAFHCAADLGALGVLEEVWFVVLFVDGAGGDLGVPLEAVEHVAELVDERDAKGEGGADGLDGRQLGGVLLEKLGVGTVDEGTVQVLTRCEFEWISLHEDVGEVGLAWVEGQTVELTSRFGLLVVVLRNLEVDF